MKTNFIKSLLLAAIAAFPCSANAERKTTVLASIIMEPGARPTEIYSDGFNQAQLIHFQRLSDQRLSADEIRKLRVRSESGGPGLIHVVEARTKGEALMFLLDRLARLWTLQENCRAGDRLACGYTASGYRGETFLLLEMHQAHPFSDRRVLRGRVIQTPGDPGYYVDLAGPATEFTAFALHSLKQDFGIEIPGPNIAYCARALWELLLARGGLQSPQPRTEHDGTRIIAPPGGGVRGGG